MKDNYVMNVECVAVVERNGHLYNKLVKYDIPFYAKDKQEAWEIANKRYEGRPYNVFVSPIENKKDMNKDRLQRIKDRCKWRGKSITYAVWRFGQLEIDEYNNAYLHYCIDSRNIPISNKVDIDTIGRYIGRKDKNGEDIYEGDILRYDDGAVVYVCYNYEEHSFALARNYTEFPFAFPLGRESVMEVIGNLFDNPELINK